MIEIDGSYGEGGGQILRTALSMAAVLDKPVKISNICAGRPNPGLSAQHVTAIESVAAMCDADVDGLYLGSKEMTFGPRQLVGGQFEFDVGTAGSVSLVVQSCLLPAAMSRSPVSMTVKGGTDVRWSPPIDFLRAVHLPVIRLFGVNAHLEIVSRGFYPEGGGEVQVEVDPAGAVTNSDLGSPGKCTRIEGVAFSQNLPEHVISRMEHAALKRLVEFKQVKISSDESRGRSTGAGIMLSAICENTVLGSSALGEKGVRAETLGETCAQELLDLLGSGATVDDHMADQVLPYMALAKGPSAVKADELSGHAMTNIWVLEKFVGKRFCVEKMGELTRISTV